jgi:hypothetical protein
LPIQVRYRLSNAKLKEAALQANDMLLSTNLIDLIEARANPFKESWPDTLKPPAVAEAFVGVGMELTLGEYTASSSSIGGKFMTGRPNHIWANRLAIPRRSECALAAMLVHECTHALSFRVKAEMRFSHCTNDSHDHRDTAPYWIQKRLRNTICLEPFVPDDELIHVELIEGIRTSLEEKEEVGDDSDTASSPV